MDKVLYSLAGGVMDFDGAAFAGVCFLFFVRQCIVSLGKRIGLLLLLFVPTILFEVIRSRKFSRLLKGEKEREKAEEGRERQ